MLLLVLYQIWRVQPFFTLIYENEVSEVFKLSEVLCSGKPLIKKKLQWKLEDNSQMLDFT